MRKRLSILSLSLFLGLALSGSAFASSVATLSNAESAYVESVGTVDITETGEIVDEYDYDVVYLSDFELTEYNEELLESLNTCRNLLIVSDVLLALLIGCLCASIFSTYWRWHK